MYEKLFKKLHEAQTVAIFMHINPDGDCIGSSLALYGYLTNLGKTAHCFLEEGNAIKDTLFFLPYIDRINAAELKHYDLGIAVDCGSANRLGNNSFIRFSKCDQHTVIDHHETSDPFVDDIILDPKAASTTQILYRIFKAFDKKAIDKNIATLLFAGLMTDSGALSFSSTTAECYRTAAELCEYGINNYEIIRKLFKEVKESVFILTNRVLNNAKFFADGKIGVISFMNKDFAETGTSQEDTDGIINRIIDIKEVKIAISIAEVDGRSYKIGIRSKDRVDSGALAKVFGGGGHFYASGCRINAPYEDVVSRITAEAAKLV